MVERAEIEAKVREIEGALDQTRESLKERAVVVAIVVVIVIAAAFVIGRRRGRARSTIVEVYEL
ncbi:MAG: hypothetical protein ACE5MI_04280 [Acidimicrobiia bacterium]